MLFQIESESRFHILEYLRYLDKALAKDTEKKEEQNIRF